jgi:hypothetical protein
MPKPRRRSTYRPVPLAVKLEANKRALQGLANLTGKAVMDPAKKDAWTQAEQLDWDGRCDLNREKG